MPYDLTRRSGFGRAVVLALLALAIVAGVVLWGELRRGNEHPGVERGVAPNATRDQSAGDLESPTEPAATAREAAPDPDAVPEPQVAGVAPLPTPDPDPFLTLRAVDGAGDPVAGVSFEWVTRIVTGRTADQPMPGVTNADGRLTLTERPHQWTARFGAAKGEEARPFGGFVKDLGVRCTLPFEAYQSTDENEAPGVLWIEAPPSAGEPLDVRLPPFGFVQFEWETALAGTGDPIDGYFLHVRRADNGHFPGWRCGFDIPGSASSYRFGPVGLGWDVYVDLSSRQVLGSLGNVTSAGPTVEGETVTIRIERTESHRTLVRVAGTAVDESNQPLVETSLRIAFGDPEERTTPQKSARTDGAGRFRLEVPREQLTPRVVVTQRYPKPGARGAATLDLSDRAQAVFDLGSVVLEPIPSDLPPAILLAKGKVDLPPGVSSAQVQVWGRARVLDDREVDPAKATRLASVSLRGEDGASLEYEVTAHAVLEEPEVSVRAYQVDCMRLPVTSVLAGTVGVDFRLVKGAAAGLAIDIEPGIAIMDPIALEFVGEGRSHHPSLMDFAAGYRNRFAGLAPGRYRLTAHCRGGNYVLHEREIEVEHGDVDLGTLDLRGRLRVVQLELTAATGERLARGYVCVSDVESGQRIDRSASVDERGRAEVFVPVEVTELRLERVGGGRGRVTLPPQSTEGTDEVLSVQLGQ